MNYRIIVAGAMAAGALSLLAACGSSSDEKAAGEKAGAPVTAPPVSGSSDDGSDALVAGTDFNATGTVPCARYDGQPTSECRFGVVRAGDGSATVTIFWPGGGSRAIFFDTSGKPIGFDANNADGSAAARLVARRNSDLNLISIGPERYEIPDVVVAGD